MIARHQRRRPTFFWQGLFIVLPVFVLALVGLLSLRQDRLLVEQEAKARAQEIADDLARKIWEELNHPGPADTKLLQENHRALYLNTVHVTYSEPADTNLFSPVFRIDELGRLTDPRDYSSTPLPQPFDETKLDPEQRQLWQAAQADEFRETNLDAAVEAYRKFMAARPAPEFAAANFNLGLLLLKQGNNQAAAEFFALVATNFPDAALESGLPAGPLAKLKLLELARSDTNQVLPWDLQDLEALCSNAVYRPTLLTPRLLAAVADLKAQADGSLPATKWQNVWQNHEQARRLYRAARKKWFTKSDDTPLIPTATWIDLEGSWLAIWTSSSEHAYLCRAEPDVRSILQVIVQNKSLSDYLAIGLEIAGRPFSFHNSGRAGLLTSPGRLDSRERPPDVSAANEPGKEEVAAHAAKANSISTAARKPVLATVTKPGVGGDVLKVDVLLSDPAALFARQHARTAWFGLLIAVSAGAALGGLFAAWRAFQRQLRLNELKSNFVSSVSHELRAPIASVRLMAEGLESGRIKDESKRTEYFRFIVQECRRLSSLIENVLDFSRIEQGRKEYEFEPTDMVALVQQTGRLMEPYAAERQMTIAVQIDQTQLSTLSSRPIVDGRALQQALVNLLDNALKHSPAGSTVTVGLEIVGAAGSYAGRTCNEPGSAENPSTVTHQPSTITNLPSLLHLWVEDPGEGIPPEEHERIFERFYRRGSELRRETQGVGIGLSIVQHIVEAHGGKVSVRSAVGKGSRFTIELPLASDCTCASRVDSGVPPESLAPN
mgnify:FL=1